MSAKFINWMGEFLGSHMKEALVSEELGRCMDDVMMEVIPPIWPLVTQIFIVVKLFDGLYQLADNPVSALVFPLLSVDLLAGVSRWIKASRSFPL